MPLDRLNAIKLGALAFAAACTGRATPTSESSPLPPATVASSTLRPTLEVTPPPTAEIFPFSPETPFPGTTDIKTGDEVQLATHRFKNETTDFFIRIHEAELIDNLNQANLFPTFQLDKVLFRLLPTTDADLTNPASTVARIRYQTDHIEVSIAADHIAQFAAQKHTSEQNRFNSRSIMLGYLMLVAMATLSAHPEYFTSIGTAATDTPIDFDARALELGTAYTREVATGTEGLITFMYLLPPADQPQA